MKLNKWFDILKKILFIYLLFCFEEPVVFACRYNIRETGFVDFGTHFYRIYFYINQSTAENLLVDFKEIMPALLDETNIDAEIINVEVDKNHEALKYFKQLPTQSIPTMLFVSPDSQSIILPVAFEKSKFELSLKKQMWGILSSVLVQQIKQKVVDNYAVVLLFESNYEAENGRAKSEIKKSINEIQQKLPWMPKEMKMPPALLSLANSQITDEPFLLWSLGIQKEEVKEPIAVIIYGRMRWLGPLFKGAQITSQKVSAILDFISLDCECGLDKRWLLGTMLPVKWDEKIQQQVVKNLGFDPENPAVKMEMSRILSTGSSFPGVPWSYEFEPSMADSATKDALDSARSWTDETASLNNFSKKKPEKVNLSFFILTLIGILIIFTTTGFVIWFKMQNKRL